jgi:cytochrome c553
MRLGLTTAPVNIANCSSLLSAALALLVLTISSGVAQEPAAAGHLAFFETKIRPVLAKRCYQCHSHRAKKLKAHLYLDSRAGMLNGGDNGPAIVPGQPDKSPLITAIGFLDYDLQMPPKKKLPDQVVSDFRTWIQMGAPWPKQSLSPTTTAKSTGPTDWNKLRQKHWAYQPIANPETPTVNNQTWGGNPIDAFVLARLHDAGLQANPPAPKYLLIRRAYIDLIGLPPSPAQVTAFENDHNDNAFAKVIEELLASPRYGERWARHWLDVARYSDGEGGFLDRAALPHAWRYRDWVIKAFNEDLPYDQFIVQQLTGDLLGDPELRVAGGFLAVGPTYTDDGGDPTSVAEAKAETLNDRVDTVTRSFLALTVACARCHDHKFDPIPTADYYSIGGVFQNTRLVKQSIASKSATDLFNKAMAPIQEAESRLKSFISEESKVYQQGVLSQGLSQYMLAAVEISRLRLSDKKRDVRTFATEQKISHTILNRFLQWITNKGRRQRFKEFQPYFDWVDANSKAYVINEELRAITKAAQETANAIITSYELGLESYQIAVKDNPKLPKPKASEAYSRLNRDLRNHCSPDLKKSNMVELVAAKQTHLSALRTTFTKANQQRPAPLPEAHFLAESGSKDMSIAIRGDIRKRGQVVPRRFLHIVAGEDAKHFTKGSGREGLAEAIADKSNPLTARVMINRIWQHHFGQAIVRTPSNFGALGERPTHPMLLDYLATQFITKGWSMKTMHRLIMLSRTYQASSKYVEKNFLIDGDNRLLWRAKPRKMAAESWRDSLLAVCGELSPDVGGEPVRGRFFQSKRRTIYAKISRNGDRYDSDRFLRLFDFPDPRTTSAGRVQSIVPQQYLFMMNSNFMISRGKSLATRLKKASDNNDAQIDLAYQLLFSRKPNDYEKQTGLAFLAAPQQNRPNLERYLQALLSTHEFMQIQ